MTAKMKQTKTVYVVPAWSRAVPRRTIVSGILAIIGAVAYWLISTSEAVGTSQHLAALSVACLWFTIITASTAIGTYCLHVRDKENFQRTQEAYDGE